MDKDRASHASFTATRISATIVHTHLRVARNRPTPDDLLRAITQTEGQRGRLKLFLGAAPGVGKTYAMLAEALEQSGSGAEVIIGYAETHGRAETESMLKGLQSIPLKSVPYKSVTLFEPDFEEIIKLHPDLVIIDELAHSNPPDGRHRKRWQDIVDLITAGINVYTAMNIQHLESLNDVVAQITGTKVRETVPDSFLEYVTEIEVVDIPATDLQKRLQEGKIYQPEKIEVALQGFFRLSSLTALRELALRRAADTVDSEMLRLRDQLGEETPWATRDRVIVCIAPNPMAKRVVRAAARMGFSSKAELIAVFVESDRQAQRQETERQEAKQALDLAKKLGMEVVTLSGHDIVAEVFGFAQRRNASLVVVGKPIRPRWKELLYGSVVDCMVRQSGDIDVYVITGEKSEAKVKKPKEILFAEPVSLTGICLAIIPGIAASVLGLLLFQSFGIANVAMVYVLAVAIFSVRHSRAESAIASILSVLAFDYIFVTPRFSFAISDSRYLLLFSAMVSIALVISTLTQRLKAQLSNASQTERRTASLYRMSQLLTQHTGEAELAAVTADGIKSVIDGEVAVFLIASEELSIIASSESGFELEPTEQGVAAWVAGHSLEAGQGTDTLPGAKGYYAPLRGAYSTVGVLAFRSADGARKLETSQLLEAFANALGVALERAILAKQSNEARIATETERLRNTLLQSISHDLRTPLTSIIGTSSLLRSGPESGRDLGNSIYQEAIKLNRQIQNLLDMTRIQSGGIILDVQWESPAELVASAVDFAKSAIEGMSVTTFVQENLPLIRVDGTLIEKALVNLLENAAKHAGKSASVEISVAIRGNMCRFAVIDDGKGLPLNSDKQLFEPFKRSAGGGFGLGLPIVKSIAELHHGTVTSESPLGGGAIFSLSLPLSDEQPEVPYDEN